jgi:predicted XRE-type DNA-binding protein
MSKHRIVNGIEIEHGSGNVYADLGYPSPESMLIKAQLVTQIGKIIKQRRLTQERAAEILGLRQPRISAMLNGRFRGISERRLLDCLTRLGRDVQIVIKPAPRSRANGRMTVLVA